MGLPGRVQGEPAHPATPAPAGLPVCGLVCLICSSRQHPHTGPAQWRVLSGCDTAEPWGRLGHSTLVSPGHVRLLQTVKTPEQRSARPSSWGDSTQGGLNRSHIRAVERRAEVDGPGMGTVGNEPPSAGSD